MALIADKMTSKKLENRLGEFSKFGMTLYYLLEEGRASINDLESFFFSPDDEKSCFIYGKLIRRVKPNDLKLSFDKYSCEYPNVECLDSCKYQDNLNLIYTKKIINRILDDFYDKIDKVYVNTYNYLLINNSELK
jgi:hypothetical protein